MENLRAHNLTQLTYPLPSLLFSLCVLMVCLCCVPRQTDARSKYRRARAEFRRANRLVRRGRYKGAIRRYRRVIRILTGSSRRAVKGRWESLFRIAVVYRRLRDYRASRSVLELLWKQAPSPASRYYKRLKRQFAKLQGKLLSELILTILPTHSTTAIKDRTGLIQARTTTALNHATKKYFDVQDGTITITISAPGYTTVTRRALIEPVRSISMYISLVRLRGYAYAMSLYHHASALSKQNRYLEAYQWFERTRQALRPNLVQQANGATLEWQALLSQAELLILLKRDSEARRRFVTMWDTYTNRRTELKRAMCQLKQRHQWALPQRLQEIKCAAHTQNAAMQRPTSPPKGKTIGPATWLLVGVGAGGLIFGGIATYQSNEALTQRQKVETSCQNCPEFKRLESEYVAWLATAWTSFVIGGAAIAAGVIIHIAKPAPTQPTHITPRIPAFPTSSRLLFPKHPKK